MSIFDKLFPKTDFERKMDDAFDHFVENNPVMKKAKAQIAQGEEELTHSLERELYGEGGEKPYVKKSDEEMLRGWDEMIDGIIDKQLSAYKICPDCGEAAPADLDHCPKCGAALPSYTAEIQICPYCGATNKALDLFCTNCGKRLELVPAENESEE